MNKIFLFFFIMLFCPMAFSGDLYSLTFNGLNYKLLYSEKTPEHSGYINEYFKSQENRNSWTEIVNIIHFPNAYSPIEHAKEFSEYLNTTNCPNALKIDEESNSAVVDFILIDGQKLPVVLEFNVFRYEKSEECGTIAVQYVKRYSVYNTAQVENIKKEFKKLRPKILKNIQRFTIPSIIKKNIDEIKLNDLQ